VPGWLSFPIPDQERLAAALGPELAYAALRVLEQAPREIVVLAWLLLARGDGPDMQPAL
jgi:hypothetical protein